YNWADSGLDVYVGGPYLVLTPWMFQSTQSSKVTFKCHPNSCNTNWQLFLN
ncbi:unnamed protein product, partial [Amoebophrya sp. A25]